MAFKSAFPLVSLLACAPLGALAAIGPIATINLVNEVIAPDGFSRSAVLAKSGSGSAGDPGPLIIGNKGDLFKLNVVNQLTDHTMDVSTSIHWHGVTQHGTSWADGVAFVTQCPIAPGNSFLYEFPVDTAGTFWYHSHLRTQYCEGLRGAFVVYDPNDPYKNDYDFDDENTVITLADWYHSVGATGVPIAQLINGKGRYVGGPNTALSVLNVEAGKKYRLRIVNAACDPNYKFSIDGHSLTVIEADGILHQPLVVDQIQILAGQRYSAILHANQPVGNYWIRSNPNRGPTGYDGGLNSAILRYSGAAATEPSPSTPPTPSAPLQESALVPLDNPGAPGTHSPSAADENINLALSRIGSNWAINGAVYHPPTVPVLLQIMSGAHTAASLLPAGAVYTLPRNKVIELTMPASNAPGSPHPMHLHGHVFDVVRVAGSTTYNWNTPVRRDVVSIGAGADNVTIRFTTDNPGPWILHCHIDRHLEDGLAVVFAEAPEDAESFAPVSTAWEDLCPIYEALDPEDQ